MMNRWQEENLIERIREIKRMNGLDRDETGFGSLSGAIYRNDGGSVGSDAGWFWYVGSSAARGPFATKAAAKADRDRLFGQED